MELNRNKMYLPLYTDQDKHVFTRISFTKFAVTTVCLPLLAFTMCVVLSITKDFESSTSTHCRVFNFLPSVSAAIGSYYPQNFFWKFAIALHALPRYFTTSMYYTYYVSRLKREVHLLAVFACILNAIEVTSLIGLSFWDSTDNYPVHKTCFITFVGASELYMLLSCILLKKHKRTSPTELERFSLKLKWSLLTINVVCFVTAGYFFTRHNTYCEPMIYSLFAASEYVVILTNMGFHMTACYDFMGREIILKYTSITIT
ncbi:post-GPI attachment to proteins factor 2-like [Arctopsyche grandis]|uniref:post-GPI attachment to proteins factor 2-like n=1 Tax=Arctopsyche grandis TaxID=121162 RepID=UPI00406D67D6